MSVTYTPRSKTRWLVTVRRADGQRAYKTVRSEREARDLATVYHGQELQGIDVVAALQRTRAKAEAPTAPLIKDAIPARISELVADGTLRHSSARNYRSRFRKWVEPAIGAIPVDRVTTEDLGAIITHVKTAGAVSAIKHILNPLRAYYRLHDDLPNPTLNVAKYIGRALRREPKPVVVFTRAEQDKILGALGPADRLFVLVSFETGLRWNEVAALAPADIDVEQRILTVRRGISARTVDAPKTASSRRPVPASPVLLRALQAHLATLPKDAAFVFPNTVGRHAHYADFHARWQAALAAASVPYRVFHTCRHSFTTRMRDAGVKLEIVSKWLGHSKPSITLDVYSHVTAEGWADAVRLKDRAAVTA